MTEVRFRLLGPLEAAAGARVLSLGGTKQRALLAVLLLHPNEFVSRERLIDELWGGRAPPGAAHNLEVYVSRLRKALRANSEAETPLLTRPGGYLLRLEPDQLDVAAFERLLAQGQQALADSDAAGAAAALAQALALWRGEPLADLALEPFAHTEVERLGELRLRALEARIEAELALGKHARLVSELEALVAREPLREALRGQLMLALYRCGRQADALEVYRATRRLLADDLGLAPSQELERLERLILTHDPQLDLPPLEASVEPGLALQPLEQAILQQDGSLEFGRQTTSTVARDDERAEEAEAIVSSARRRRRHLRWVAPPAAAAAVGALIAVLAVRGGGEAITVRPNSVALIDPKTNKVVADVRVGARPGAVAVGEGAVWVSNLDDSTLSRINPKTRAERTIPMLGVSPSDIAVGAGGVWVANGPDNAAVRVSPETSNIVVAIPTADCGGFDANIAVGEGAVWFVCRISLVRIDPASNHAVASRYTGVAPRGIDVGLGAVWVSNSGENTVSRINPETRQVTDQLTVAGDPRSLAVGEGAVWVSAFRDDQVSRLAARLGNRPTTESIQVGDGPIDVAVGAGSVWVANSRDGTVSRIDPRTLKVVATIHVGNSPRGIAVGADTIWVTVQAPEKGGLPR